MALYNLTNLTNQSNVIGILQAENNFSGGWMGIMIVVSLTIILFATFKQNATTKAAGAGSLFIGVIIALLLRTAGILSEYVLLFMILGAAGMAAVLIFTD